MTTAAAIEAEALLRDIYKHESALNELAGELQSRGLAAEDLPERRAIRAIALLGDHDRAAVVADVRDAWDELRDCDATEAPSPDAVSTPLLRLLSYARPHASNMVSLRETLEVADTADTPHPTPEMFQCEQYVDGAFWGRCVRVHFTANGIDALGIRPDAVFGFRPQPQVLRATEGRIHGEFSVLADRGSITFLMRRSATGEVYRHVMTVRLAETPEELRP